MTLNEATKILMDKYPGRIPVRYAQNGDTWYFFTENTVNNGRHLKTLIENGYFTVTETGVFPVTPLDFPMYIKFKRIHENLHYGNTI